MWGNDCRRIAVTHNETTCTALRKERKRDTIFESLSVITLGSADCLFISKSSSLDLEFDTHEVRAARVRRFTARAAFFFGLDNFVLFNCAVSVGLVENNKNKCLLFCIGCLSPVLAHNLLSSLTIDKEKNFVIAVDVAPYFLKR